MNRILISHIDLDGVGSPVIAKLYFQNYFNNIILRDYNFEQNEDDRLLIEQYDEVIIADLSAPEEYINSLINKGIKVQIYDHHLGASWLKDKPYGIYDENRCGTKLFWEEWAKPQLSRYYSLTDDFVELVDVYDRWQQDNPLWEEAKALNSVLYNKDIDWKQPDAFIKYSSFIESMIYKIKKTESHWIWTSIEEGYILDAIKKEKEVYNKAISTMKIREDNRGYKFAIIAISSKISLICSEILKNRPDLDYIICLNLFNGLNGKLSFRTARKDLDLNNFIVCKGHQQAAGGIVIPELAEKFWNNENLCWAFEGDEGVNPEIPSTWLVPILSV